MFTNQNRRPKSTARNANLGPRRRARRPSVESLEGRVVLSTFTVSNTSDAGAGSLRQAILDSNAATVSTNTIDFSIGSGVQTITPLSPLPAVSHAVVINGTSQPGFAGAPLIELDGASAGSGANGIELATSGATVKGLVINRFSFDGVKIDPFDNGNTVSGNYIGTDTTGKVALGNYVGVYAFVTSNNVIGGTTSAARNILSGNAIGVELEGASGNVVEGNYVGTDVTGAAPLGNTTGILLFNSATANIIGGTSAGARNVISGNTNDGVQISDAGTSGNVVEGDYLGTDLTGSVALGNTNFGVDVVGGATNNTVGGTTTTTRDIISANGSAGVLLSGSGTSGNVVEGDYIGTSVVGTAAVGNYLGVEVSGGATANTVGGAAAGTRNVISGNTQGVDIHGAGTSGNVVEGNYVGTTPTGSAALGNSSYGVIVWIGATGNTIGGTATLARNVISGNQGVGVDFFGPGTSNNVAEGNYIGTNSAGTGALGNGVYGVEIQQGATKNTVGGTATGTRNVVSANQQGGILILDAGTSGNVVAGNYVGTTSTGTAALGNSSDGVTVAGGATGNTVGGTTSTARNVISGNAGNGVSIHDAGTSNNLVEGNDIGTTSAGTAALANGNDGVIVSSGATGNTVGGTATGARNVISANGANGVEVTGAGTSGNVVAGNDIGTTTTGKLALGNKAHGVLIAQGATGNTVGGTSAGARNIISANGADGVYVTGAGTSSNLIEGDYIGTDTTGKVALGNKKVGVVIDQGATKNTVGGTTAGARVVIDANQFGGLVINGSGTSGNVVEGDYIGVNVTGTVALGNGYSGVTLSNYASNNTVGGNTAGAGNVISGNSADGVDLTTGASGNLVQGNAIGTDAGHTLHLGNGQNGVAVATGATNNAIGEPVGVTDPADGNTIAFNGGYGVAISGATGNAIQANSIFSNTSGGIQNSSAVEPAPVLTSVTVSGGTTTIQGVIIGSPVINGNLTLEFFSNASGAQGQTLIGEAVVTTDGSGDATFTVVLGTAVPSGRTVTATSTDSSGNTSVFSNALTV